MEDEQQQLRERALAGDSEAAERVAWWLQTEGYPERRQKLSELARATRMPEFIEPLVSSAHLTGDVETLEEWGATSAQARRLLPHAISNRDHLSEIEHAAAAGDRTASWELAVYLGLANDRVGLHRLATSGNPVAAVLLCDLAFWDDDIDLLRELARTGLAVCIANFVQMAPDREVEELAVAGNVVAFTHRCQEFINAGDVDGLRRFVASMPDAPAWT